MYCVVVVCTSSTRAAAAGRPAGPRSSWVGLGWCKCYRRSPRAAVVVVVVETRKVGFAVMLVCCVPYSVRDFRETVLQRTEPRRGTDRQESRRVDGEGNYGLTIMQFTGCSSSVEDVIRVSRVRIRTVELGADEIVLTIVKGGGWAPSAPGHERKKVSRSMDTSMYEQNALEGSSSR